MGLTLTNLSGYQRGLEAAETGINASSFSCRYFMQFKDFVANYQGQNIGFATPDKLSREVSVDGEVSSIGSLSGLMAVYWNAAVTFGNDVGTFVAASGGSNAGGFYVDEITESQSRDGWRSISLRASSHPLCT